MGQMVNIFFTVSDRGAVDKDKDLLSPLAAPD